MNVIKQKDNVLSNVPCTPVRVVESFDLTCVQILAVPVPFLSDNINTHFLAAFCLSGPGLLDAREKRAVWGAVPLEELKSLDLSSVLDWRRTLIRGVKYVARGFVVDFSGWLGAWKSWSCQHHSINGDFQPTGWLGTGELATALTDCIASTIDASREVSSVCCALFLACRSASAHNFIPLLVARLISLGGVPPSAASWWDDALVRAAAIGEALPLDMPASLGGTGPVVHAEATPWSPSAGMVDPSRVRVIFVSIDNSGLVLPRVVALKAVRISSVTVDYFNPDGSSEVKQVVDDSDSFFSFVRPDKPIERRVAHWTNDECVKDAPLLSDVWASFIEWASPEGISIVSSDGTPQVLLVAYNGWGFDFPVLLTDLMRLGCNIPGRWRLCSLAYELRMRPGCMHPDFFGAVQPTRDQQHCYEGPVSVMPYQRLAELYELLHGEVMAAAGPLREKDVQGPFNVLADVRGMAKCFSTASREQGFALSWRHTQSFLHAKGSFSAFVGFKVAASDAIELPDELPLSRILGVGAAAVRYGLALIPPDGPVELISDLRRVYTKLNLGESPGAAELWARKRLGIKSMFAVNVAAQMRPLANSTGDDTAAAAKSF
jgi:hypothetical protein